MLRRLSDRGTTGDLASRSGVDLPPASWSLLEHLEARGSLRVSQIAACHGVDVSSVTPRLQRLESAGLVERQRAPGDGRVSLISLAPDGARALQRIHRARCEILRGAADGIDDAALAVAADVLGRIGAELSADDAGTRDGTDGRD
jgi:DNA-binding MarR family transcriptional regulator